MLLEGRTVSLGDHPDSMITEVYLLLNGKSAHVIVGKEVQDKLFDLQGIIDLKAWLSFVRTYQVLQTLVSTYQSATLPRALWSA